MQLELKCLLYSMLCISLIASFTGVGIEQLINLHPLENTYINSNYIMDAYPT